MPIKPENRALYPADANAMFVRDVLTDDEWHAMHVLLSAGFDATRQSDFWEVVVARMLGGERTEHGALHDVEVSLWGRDCHVEVKFATATFMHYRAIRGKDWSRHVFKWALPRGNSGKHTADAIVLIGYDAGLMYAWVMPRDAVRPDCKSITVCTPRDRKPGTSGRWDSFVVPATELLPAVARICHNILDMPMRQANAAVTRRAKAAAGDLFGAKEAA